MRWEAWVLFVVVVINALTVVAAAARTPEQQQLADQTFRNRWKDHRSEFYVWRVVLLCLGGWLIIRLGVR